MREFRYDGACANAAAINSAIVGDVRADTASRVDDAAMTPTFP
jgi:hypothetical protein